MARENLFINGSTWFKADFHLHTKSDKQFDYCGDDFCSDYINALVGKDVNLGVITNHNKFIKEEYKQLRDAAKKQNIWILPGVELSINDGSNGIHTLIVFDPETWINEPTDYINRFISSAFEDVYNSENADQRCKYNVSELLKKLSEHRAQGRDSLIIFAHVDADNGFLKGLKGGSIKQIADNELFDKFVLGFQKSREFDLQNMYNTVTGKELPALLEGSDCKSIDEVGKFSTKDGNEICSYVKLGHFNFKALRFALVDHCNRVSCKKVDIKNQYIRSIAFNGGKLDGVTINFSPELNSLIGIRGSGKSAIIEILRYALGISLTSSSSDNQYKGDLLEYILGSGGTVTVEVVGVQGKAFRIEKTFKQQANIYDENGNLLDCSISAVLADPIYFGQKDLSNKNKDFQSDLLTRFIGAKLNDINKKINAKETEVQYILLDIKKTENVDSIMAEAVDEIKDIQTKLTFFKEQGLEDKLRKQAEFDSDRQILDSFKSNLINYNNSLNIAKQNKDWINSKISGSDQNKAFFDKAEILRLKLIEEDNKLFAIISNVDALTSELAKLILEVDERKKSFAEEFAEIKRQVNTDTINPDLFLDLRKKLNYNKLKLEQIGAMKAKQNERKKALLNRITELNNLWKDRFLLKQKEAENINARKDDISIDVTYKGKREKFYDKLKEVFRGTSIRDSVYHDIVDKYQDFIEIYRDESHLSDVLGINNVGSFVQRFHERIDELLTYNVEDDVVFKYKGKSLDQHSLGQRASALILFLLTQKGNNILIIDQPEDDLDNQTIYNEIIKKLVSLKGEMQFIFATHNANIPVLGDSEQVFDCSFESSKIKVNAGTIDTPESQKAIVDIMEGGREAFKLRKDIYNIWSIKK